jgi:hypothetical protein
VFDHAANAKVQATSTAVGTMKLIVRRLPITILSFFLLFPHPVWAQEASVTGARMLWYGVYQAGSTTTIEDKASPTGRRTVSSGIVPPKVSSDRIPAILNTRFGFGYVLMGSPANAVAKMRHVRNFPAGGIVNPKTGQRYFKEQVELNLGVSQKDLFIGYLFEENFTLVPGVWHFEVWNGNRKLLEKRFTVYKP